MPTFARPAAALATLALLAGCAKPPSGPPPATEVEVAPVTQRDVPVTGEWVASLAGFVDAQIRAQVTGTLVRQDYKEGSVVHAGDLLFEIDPRPFQALLAQAQAQLGQAQAQQEKTRLDVKRFRPLAAEQAISQEELDDAVQADRAAAAAVAAAAAAVQQAQLNLDFARVVSPVTGVAGFIQAQIGDLVGPGTGVLTTVSTVDPIKVYFPISEQAYLDFSRSAPAGGGIPADLPLALILSDGRTYRYPGKLYATDRQIDPGTGALRLAALFPNPAGLLRPGQYGRVRAVVRVEKGALLVPQRALTELQGGYQVALVDAQNQVHLRTVTPGPQVGSSAVIESGLEPGDRVVAEGLQKVRDGLVVVPRPFAGE
jgi:membrane fusion protein (multidrug efflux system)